MQCVTWKPVDLKISEGKWKENFEKVLEMKDEMHKGIRKKMEECNGGCIQAKR